LPCKFHRLFSLALETKSQNHFSWKSLFSWHEYLDKKEERVSSSNNNLLLLRDVKIPSSMSAF